MLFSKSQDDDDAWWYAAAYTDHATNENRQLARRLSLCLAFRLDQSATYDVYQITTVISNTRQREVVDLPLGNQLQSAAL